MSPLPGCWSVDVAAVAAGVSATSAAEYIRALLCHGVVRHVDRVGDPRFEVLNLVRTAHRAPGAVDRPT